MINLGKFVIIIYCGKKIGERKGKLTMKKKIIVGSMLILLLSGGIIGIKSVNSNKNREISPKKAVKEIYGKSKINRLDEKEIKNLKMTVNTVEDAYNVEKDGKNKGKAIIIRREGAKGKLDILIGFDLNGTIEGVKVLKNQETPSIGGKVASSDFTEEFKGNKIEEELEVDTISRATKTSMAIIKGVEEGKSAYKDVYN